MAAKAGCNRPEMLEFREEPLDQISHLVDLRAEGGWIFTNTERADVGERALFSQFGANGVTVVGAISEQNRAFTNPPIIVSNALPSWAWPAVSFSAIGKPLRSTMAWILVVFPPRERPMQSLSPPFCHR